MIEQLDKSEKLLYPNLQRYLEEVYGYYVWKQHDDFSLFEHVVMAPLHYHGRSISSRNIQVS